MYMLRKFFIILFLFIVGSIPVFAFDTNTGTLSGGECWYEQYGMRCGVGGCASDARCVYDQAYVLGTGTVHVGKCVTAGVGSEYPCASIEATVGDITDGCMENCPNGFRRQSIADIRSGKVIKCYAGVSIPCFSYDNVAGYQKSVLSLCVADATCTVSASGCNFNEYPFEKCAEGGCTSAEICKRVPQYNSTGDVVGYLGQCIPDTSCGGSGAPSCSLPDGLGSYCGSKTGCDLLQYCNKTSILGGTLGAPTCFGVSITGGTPSSCFASTGGICGKSVSNPTVGGSTEWPADWNKTIYCASGDSCITTSDTPYIGKTPATYPDSGICAKCVQGTGSDPCTGAIQPNTHGLDDCCSPTKKCSGNGLCQDIGVFTQCAAPNSDYLKPGSICKYSGTTEDRCSKCPVTVDGGSSYVDQNSGNSYCKDIVYTGSQVTSTCSNACGCPAGNVCDNGVCKSAGSCIPKGQACTLGGTSCCDAAADMPFSCLFTGSGGTNPYTCRSLECEQVASTGNCTDATEKCCPDDKPFCNDGVCGEAFQCTSEGECCPGFGEVCNADKQCEPAPAGECIGEDNTLPPAPGYLGPQIEIPQLFSAIGAILYPAGIGIGLFFIIRAGYVIMMSEGNPDEVKRGQEHLTSAVIGTLFIVLSTAILRVIINTLLG